MNELRTIPVCDLRAQVDALRSDLDAAIARVLESGWFVLGREVEQFEEDFARWVGASHAIGVASGTDAIHLALRAAGVRAGDLVLTAPNSATPTACGITELGAIPCFADVDPVRGLLDPDAVERELERHGGKVRALLPVHLYGRCVDMGRFLAMGKRFGIPVIEDAAQAHGATWEGRAAGTMGALTCFSFYPTKNLGAYGDGGAVTTDDPELARSIRYLRNYGQADRYQHVTLGFNSRLDELQAAILRVKLPHLTEWNHRRRVLADRYRAKLAGLPLEMQTDLSSTVSVEHLFVVRVARRERVREELGTLGVSTQVHYPIPIHRQGAYDFLELGPGTYPVAEERAEQVLTLPLYPELTFEEQDRVIAALAAALKSEPAPKEIGR